MAWGSSPSPLASPPTSGGFPAPSALCSPAGPSPGPSPRHVHLRLRSAFVPALVRSFSSDARVFVCSQFRLPEKLPGPSRVLVAHLPRPQRVGQKEKHPLGPDCPPHSRPHLAVAGPSTNVLGLVSFVTPRRDGTAFRFSSLLRQQPLARPTPRGSWAWGLQLPILGDNIPVLGNSQHPLGAVGLGVKVTVGIHLPFSRPSPLQELSLHPFRGPLVSLSHQLPALKIRSISLSLLSIKHRLPSVTSRRWAEAESSGARLI